jgi:hypothetical protein
MSPQWIALACAAVVVLAVWLWRKKRRTQDNFYTLYADEEPTRSYVPYVGTIPYGEWGVQPWAEAHPVPQPANLNARLRDVAIGEDVAPIYPTCGSTRAGGPSAAPYSQDPFEF